MVPVPVGVFCAGSLINEQNQDYYEFADEIPRLERITEPFYMAQYPVTNAQYRQFVKETGRREPEGLRVDGERLLWNFKPWQDPQWNQDDQPVVCVTYDDMTAFCEWLSKEEGKTYTLPDKNQWEYVCRAGTTTDYNWGTNEISLELANYNPSDEARIILTGSLKPVGAYKPNAWGVCDMHGNVNEATSTISPCGNFFTARGGGYLDTARRCRSSSNRNRCYKKQALASIGFRVICKYESLSPLVVRMEPPVTVIKEEEYNKEKDEFGLGGLLWQGSNMQKLRDGAVIISSWISHDGGVTWAKTHPLPGSWSIQLRDGIVLSSTSGTEATTDQGVGVGKGTLVISADNWQTIRREEILIKNPKVCGGFDDCCQYHEGVGAFDHAVVELNNGHLIGAFYGQYAGNTNLQDYQRYPMETKQWKYYAWISLSTDKGRSWNHLSDLPYDPQTTRGGLCEIGLIDLPNGEVLAAARTGEHSWPNEYLLFFWSKDKGRSWSKPEKLMVEDYPFIGIYPNFCRMSNGWTAIVWGRTGLGASVCVAFNIDGTGRNWTGLTRLPFKGSGMCDIVELSPGRLLVSGSHHQDGKVELQAIKLSVRTKSR